ncbi:BTAD domain-containing putative transcriptional regulator [Streptomyces sp. NPDC006430]|uniref:AfsR/SARP family transcriptional regulator n=1 Tax=Streptomyces sp. NPDC006430 TaxID=3154299 RepID=UPI0033AA6D13
MGGLRIAVLGPLRAWRGNRELDIGPAQQRAVLAALALRGGQVAQVQELLDGIWGWDPPASAAAALRNYVSRLRTVLEPDPRAPTALLSVAGGYALRLDERALDATLCERLAADAEQALEAGSPERATGLLGEALALWGGVPLTGVPGDYADRQRDRLAERRLVLLEKRLALELELGRHAEATAELSALADEHPLREGLRALQMLALYRCGRQADALAGYGRTRRFLSEELGIAPGPELARLHQRILQSDPGLAAPDAAASTTAANTAPEAARAPAPVWIPAAQLPPNIPDFTGRQETVANLRRTLCDAAEQTAVSAAVCVVHGMGGVGKTTVAVHAAHGARDRFPDGQLYVDLRGASSDPADPYAVQQSFLLALGMSPRNIPADPIERTALYRTRLAGGRLLLLLDNAVSSEQVRPLLPSTAGCAALITSRSPLACLPVTSRTGLEPFTEQEALALLERIAGPERLPKEPEAARSLVHACGLLPLAVRIAASRLSVRPRWTIASLTSRLTDRSRRLTELQAGGLAVEAAFELGYTSLTTAQARAFRLLAIPETPEITPGSAAALLDCTEHAAENILESLTNAGLLESCDPGRYRYHDLLRLFARHRTLKSDASAERKAALSRLARFHLAGLSAAMRAVRPYSRLAEALDPRIPGGPRFTERAEAQRWMISEQAAILGVAAQMAHHPTRPICADDARTLGRTFVLLLPFTELQIAWGSLLGLGHVLLDEAEDDDDAPAIVNACALLALAYASTGQHEQARNLARRGYLTTAPDDRVFKHRLAYVMGTVAAMDPNSLDEAVTHFEEAARLCRAVGETGFEAQCMLGLAMTHLARKEPDRALGHCREAFALNQAAQCALGTVLALCHLGRALNELGRHDEAVEQYSEALATCDAHDLPTQRAHTLLGLALAHFEAGRPAPAAEAAEAAVPLLAVLGDTAGRRRAEELLGRIDGGGEHP